MLEAPIVAPNEADKVTRKTVPYPTDPKLPRSNSKLSTRPPRFSGTLKSLFKRKEKKASDQEVWMMYAGTMSCPVLTPPESQNRTPPEPEEESVDDASVEETPTETHHRRVPSTVPSKPLPILPLDTFLPKHDITNYESALEKAVQELRNDFQSGARQLADSSLAHLAHITEIGASVATTWGKFWAIMVHAAKQLGQARPSMSAAITSCLLRTLERVARRWNDETEKGQRNTGDLVRIARGLLEEIRHERCQISARLDETFATWLRENFTPKPPSGVPFISGPGIPFNIPSPPKTPRTIRILTLSNSSTVILHALVALPNFDFHLTILESRPRCEGADMASQILSAATDKQRLSVRIVPDSAVGTAARNIDIALLGADRISSTGDVSNKSGSIAAALCVKQLNSNAAVIVVSDIDKIATPEVEQRTVETHPSRELSSAWAPDTRNKLEEQEKLEVFGEWFEWVPSKYVDMYVTELGIFDIEDVEKVAREIQQLDEYIFQKKKDGGGSERTSSEASVQEGSEKVLEAEHPVWRSEARTIF
jgi:translation initiation factor 2B subunit (eIF-2B alpha/beta/delta family)